MKLPLFGKIDFNDADSQDRFIISSVAERRHAFRLIRNANPLTPVFSQKTEENQTRSILRHATVAEVIEETAGEGTSLPKLQEAGNRKSRRARRSHHSDRARR